MLFLSKGEPESFIRITELAQKTKIPRPYLAKLVKRLVGHELLEGRKGPGGGVRLTEKGRGSSFYDICESTNEPLIRQNCFLSHTACNAKAPCPFHNNWREISGAVLAFLQKSKIA